MPTHWVRKWNFKEIVVFGQQFLHDWSQILLPKKYHCKRSCFSLPITSVSTIFKLQLLSYHYVHLHPDLESLKRVFLAATLSRMAIQPNTAQHTPNALTPQQPVPTREISIKKRPQNMYHSFKWRACLLLQFSLDVIQQHRCVVLWKVITLSAVFCGCHVWKIWTRPHLFCKNSKHAHLKLITVHFVEGSVGRRFSSSPFDVKLISTLSRFWIHIRVLIGWLGC